GSGEGGTCQRARGRSKRRVARRFWRRRGIGRRRRDVAGCAPGGAPVQDPDNAESGLTPPGRAVVAVRGQHARGMPVGYIRFTDLADLQSVTLYVLWTADRGVR